MFDALGRFAYRFRRWTIALWVFLLIVSLSAVPALEQVLTETGTVYQGGKAYQAEQVLRQEFGIAVDGLTLVFRQDSQQTGATGLQAKETAASLQSLLQQIRKLPAVNQVISPAPPASPDRDRRTQYSVIELKDSGSSSSNEAIGAIESLMQQYSPPGWRTYLIGKPVVDREIQQISREDLRRIELLVLPITLLALLLVFGSVVAAILPILVAVFTVSITFGLLYAIALRLDVSVFALNLVTMLGLGLGIDYSLLIVNRFREELTCGSTEQAIAQTINTAGRAVFFSGVTVAIGLVCLLLFPISLLRSFGIAGAIVVGLSVATALTLLPALLGTVGGRLQQPRIGGRWIAVWENGWKRLAQSVVRHSIPAILTVLVIVAGLTAPFLQSRFGIAGAEVLPQGSPARQGIEVLQESFGAGAVSPIFLLIKTSSASDAILSQSHLKTLYELVQQLQADPRVKQVSSLFNLNPAWDLKAYQRFYRANAGQLPSQITTTIQSPTQNATPQILKSDTPDAQAVQELTKQTQSWKLNAGQNPIANRNATLITLESRTDSRNKATRDLINDLQSRKLDGLELSVAGQTAQELDTIAAVSQRFPVVVLVIMGMTFIVLSLLLKSVILPLKAIAMNLLSIGASFGSLVFIFQEGNFQDWLQFTPPGYLDILLPIVLFCVLFGLSMDYEVFLLTRIKEAYEESKNNTESVIQGLQATGGIITSAALLMILVTSAFVMARIIFVKALGLGSAIAVLIDVTLIRAVLVPATMHLLGKWNWWYPRFDRLPAPIKR